MSPSAPFPAALCLCHPEQGLCLCPVWGRSALGDSWFLGPCTGFNPPPPGTAAAIPDLLCTVAATQVPPHSKCRLLAFKP